MRCKVPTAARRITIDEVQRAPDLLLSIKESVDGNKANGRFLLTGSANLLLMEKVSESLAGSDRDELFTGYTQTYLERDLRDLAAIDNLYDYG